jgi:hypothetical protein
MNSEQKNPSGMSEHEKKNEGGRESGHVHEPTQAQQVSKNQGVAGNPPQSGKQQGTGQQQSGAGSHQGAGSQQGKPPGNVEQEQKKTNQEEKKSA